MPIVKFGGVVVAALILVAAVLVMGLRSANAESLRWKCTYSSVASPTGVTGEKFSLEFTLDTVTKKAVVIGNAGMSDVDAVGGSQALTFQERLSSGAVQTTTITNDRSSVHSRHTMINGKLTPSQYYGTCR
jgi:hypothetical protein